MSNAMHDRSAEPDREGARKRAAVLLVRLHDGEIRAVYLADVVQIDEIDTSRVVSDGVHFLTALRGQIVPLVGLASHGDGRRKRTVLFFREGARLLGLAVGRALDIVPVTPAADTVVVSDRPVRLVQIPALFEEAYAGLDLTPQMGRFCGSMAGRLRALLANLFARTPGSRPA